MTVLEPGASLRVVWDGYVDHPSHFRISFDDDGDDDFVDPAFLSGCDTRSPQIELYSNETVPLDGIPDSAGGESEAIVQLPDIECETCTLQVIQVMYDKPPYITPGNDIYYQCADLALRRAAAATPTPQETPAPSRPPTPSATPPCVADGSPRYDCAGDCDGDGRVGVNELVTIVRIALERAPLSVCAACDLDENGAVEIGEIVAAVSRSLRGCVAPE